MRVIQRAFVYKTYAETFGKTVYEELSLQTKLLQKAANTN